MHVSYVESSLRYVKYGQPVLIVVGKYAYCFYCSLQQKSFNPSDSCYVTVKVAKTSSAPSKRDQAVGSFPI